MDEEKINRLINKEKIKQSIAYAADLINQLESDPQLISVMNYAVDVKTLVRCAENWLMVLEMEPSQEMKILSLCDYTGNMLKPWADAEKSPEIDRDEVKDQIATLRAIWQTTITNKIAEDHHHKWYWDCV